MRIDPLTIAVIFLTAVLLYLLNMSVPAHAAGYSELIMYQAGVGPNFDRTKIRILWRQVSFEKPRDGCSICVGGQSATEIFASTVGTPENYVLIDVRLAATNEDFWGPTSMRFFYVDKKDFQKSADRDSGQSPFKY